MGGGLRGRKGPCIQVAHRDLRGETQAQGATGRPSVFQNCGFQLVSGKCQTVNIHPKMFGHKHEAAVALISQRRVKKERRETEGEPGSPKLISGKEEQFHTRE